MSVLELLLKLLDASGKSISIIVGLNSLRKSWKEERDKKNHRG